MREKTKSRLRLRIIFVMIVWLGLILSIAVTGLVIGLLDMIFTFPPEMPNLVWILAIGSLISNFVISFMGTRIFKPIAILTRSMAEVAEGNYKVRAETKSHIREIRDAYESFNIMAGELEATELLQEDFIANASHEVKTPINAIEGYAMLLQGENDSEKQEEYIEKILFNTRRMSDLVGNILLLSRLENQAVPVKKSRYRLDEQIRQALLSLERKWTEKEIDFSVNMDEITCKGNESLLMQVWVNLIDNAVKFSPTESVIQMSLEKGQDGIIFMIHDEGPGIDEEVQKRIFQKFYQADSSHKEEGNGLGLVLVKRILELHGGSIKVKNGEDSGSIFTVWLPDKN